jgi:hypothetical protein
VFCRGNECIISVCILMYVHLHGSCVLYKIVFRLALSLLTLQLVVNLHNDLVPVDKREDNDQSIQ